MKIKPIRTAEDLALAKARIAKLLRTNESGACDDELEVLAALVEQFENTQVNIDAPSPVAAIKFRMAMMGLSPRQLEPFIGSRARVSEVLSEKRQLSIDMIRSLHEGLAIPYESLISGRSKSADVDRVSAPTIAHLKSLGFKVQRNDILTLFGTMTDSPSALFRKTRTQRTASKMDRTALVFWQAAVLKKSELQTLPAAFDHPKFGAQVLRAMARLSTKVDGPRRALRGLAEQGISIVILESFPGTFLDGAAMVTTNGRPVIGLTLRHDRLDGFWFTLMHELAHVALHYEKLMDQEAVFVDDMEIRSEDTEEREADELARESLIPSAILSQIHWGEGTTQDEIVAAAIRARVHVSVVAGRWQRDHQNYKRFSRLIERNTVRESLQLK